MNKGRVRDEILAFASQHEIAINRSNLNPEIADAISRLSDNDVKTDEARTALIGLRRANIITQQEGHDWLLRLHDEEEQISGFGKG